MLQPTLEKTEITLLGQDVTDCYMHHFNDVSSKRRIFVGYKCHHECGANGYKCNVCIKSIYSCPYIYEKVEIKQPNRNNKEYQSWVDIDIKMKLRIYFGDYWKWVYDHRTSSLSEAEFKMIKDIPAFRLENLSMNKRSVEDWEKMIIDDYQNNKDTYISLLSRMYFDVPIINEILKFYYNQLLEFKEGLSLNVFLSSEDRQYYDWKQMHSTSLIEVGEYTVISTDGLVSLRASWPKFLKYNNIYNNMVFNNFYFKTTDLTKAYYFFNNCIYELESGMIYTKFKYRQIVEELYELCVKNNLIVDD